MFYKDIYSVLENCIRETRPSFGAYIGRGALVPFQPYPCSKVCGLKEVDTGRDFVCRRYIYRKKNGMVEQNLTRTGWGQTRGVGGVKPYNRVKNFAVVSQASRVMNFVKYINIALLGLRTS